MADDSGAAGAGASQEPGAGDAIQKAMSGMLAGMSTAEKAIALGALLVLLINALLGDMILDDAGVSRLEFLLAGGALLAILRRGRSNSPWQSLYPWIVEALAAAYAALGIWVFLDWLFDGFDGLEGATVFYTIVEWASIALMGYGAWLLHRAHD